MSSPSSTIMNRTLVPCRRFVKGLSARPASAPRHCSVMFRFLPSRETAFALFLMLMGFGLLSLLRRRRHQSCTALVLSSALRASVCCRDGPGRPPCKARRLVPWVSCLISNIDTGLRGYLMDAYQSTLNSDFIIESVANTHADEAVEYFSTALFDVLFWAALACVTFLFQTVVLMRRIRCRTFTPVRCASRRSPQ